MDISSIVLNCYNSKGNESFLEKTFAASKDNFSRLVHRRSLSGIPENLRQQNMQYILREFSQKTQKLLAEINSFQFPSQETPFFFRMAEVSQNEKLKAAVSSHATLKSYYLDIDKLAGGQSSRSRLLPKNEQSGVAPGNYEFELNVNGTSQKISFTLDPEKTEISNQDLLSALCFRLNNSNSDLQARVREMEEKVYSDLSNNLYRKMVYLQLEHAQSGREQSFEITDVSGDLIETLQLNKTSQSPLSAKFQLDGNDRTSSSNSISLDEGRLNLTLLQPSLQPVEISISNGEQKLGFLVMQVLQSYNEYLDWLRSNRPYIHMSVEEGFYNSLRSRKDDLQSIGLQLESDGKINISSAFLSKIGSKPQTVREVLSGEEGLFPAISSCLQEIEANGAGNYLSSASEFTTYAQTGYLNQASGPGENNLLINRYT